MDNSDKNQDSSKDNKETVLEKLNSKIQKQNEEIERLNKLKMTDDIAPGIRKQRTFEGAYKNGYENGEVAAFAKKQKEKELLATVEV